MYAVEWIDRGSTSAAVLEDWRVCMSRFRKVIVLWLLAACLCGSVLTGCNTLGGAGEDIEQAGEGIQRAVD
jgi:predicted small secreted protein